MMARLAGRPRDAVAWALLAVLLSTCLRAASSDAGSDPVEQTDMPSPAAPATAVDAEEVAAAAAATTMFSAGNQHCHVDGECDAGDGEENLLMAGHLQPLGSHQEASPDLEEFPYLLPPETFRDNFIHTSTPAVFRQVLDMDTLAIFLNDTRLADDHGDAEVTVEMMKKERRGGPARAMRLREFVRVYNDTDIYLADALPQELRPSWTIPAMLLCGGIPQRISAVRMWFSSGGTSSVLHVDSNDNLHCLVDGVKHLVLIDKRDRDTVGMDRELDGSFTLDPDRVDMTRFRLAGVEWWNVTLHGGDCVYIPELWLHQVRSYHRNLAVNVWWKDQLLAADRADCDTVTSQYDCHEGNPYNCREGVRASEIEHFDETSFVREILGRAADDKGRVDREQFALALPEAIPGLSDEIAERLFGVFDTAGRGYMVPAEDLTPDKMEAAGKLLMEMRGGDEDVADDVIADAGEQGEGELFPPLDGEHPFDDPADMDTISRVP